MIVCSLTDKPLRNSFVRSGTVFPLWHSVAHGRYRRFLAFWNASPLKDMDGEGLFVPKMHAVLHLLEFLVLFGAVDNARLGDQEKDHQPYVKKAVRRTRQWEKTFEDEVLSVADRIDAMLQIRSEECAACATCCAARARRTETANRCGTVMFVAEQA